MASLRCLRTVSLTKIRFSQSVIRPVVLGYASSPSSASGAGSKKPSDPPAGAATAKPPAASQPPAAKPPVSDGTKYSCPDYYAFNDMSFFDIDAEMSKHRIQQPSKFKKLAV